MLSQIRWGDVASFPGSICRFFSTNDKCRAGNAKKKKKSSRLSQHLSNTVWHISVRMQMTWMHMLGAANASSLQALPSVHFKQWAWWASCYSTRSISKTPAGFSKSNRQCLDRHWKKRRRKERKKILLTSVTQSLRNIYLPEVTIGLSAQTLCRWFVPTTRWSHSNEKKCLKSQWNSAKSVQNNFPFIRGSSRQRKCMTLFH